MPRVAGDEPGYTFALCQVTYEDVELTAAEILEGKQERRIVLTPTDDAIVFPSASTIIKETLGKPASAMAWWGFRIGVDKVTEIIAAGDGVDILQCEDRGSLEAVLKEHGANPNMTLDSAGDRGNSAHGILELLADGQLGEAEDAAAVEARESGTEYGFAVLEWWNEQVQPFIDSGQILEVRSEQRVWSLEDRYAGTFDLALLWSWDAGDDEKRGWEVLDLKTHKPAQGFTKPGQGGGYLSDVIQIRAYRKAFEEMGLGRTIGQRVILARDKAYRKQRWVEDRREADYELFRLLRKAYDHLQAFEKGAGNE